MRLITLLLTAMLAIMTGCSLGPNSPAADSETAQVTAVVNGRDIVTHDIDVWTSHLQALAVLSGQDPQPITQKSVLDRVIENELLVSEAKRRGISVSDSDVHDFATKQRSELSQLPTKNVKLLRDYLQQRGMTEDEFWHEQESIFYPLTLYHGKLQQSVASDLKSQDMSEINAKVQQLLGNLKAKAKIHIVDERFK